MSMSLEATTSPPPEPEASPEADSAQPPGLAHPAARDHSAGFDCKALLRGAGLRPTRQRMLLGAMLFADGGRHVSAEMLYDEVRHAGIPISLATVYNTLHQFTQAGLMRQIGVNGSKSFFDTTPTAHPHFFVDSEDMLFDVPAPGVAIDRLPVLPGYEISRIDLIVHLRRK
jgi:Fur family iron response transcriptional regulator